MSNFIFTSNIFPTEYTFFLIKFIPKMSLKSNYKKKIVQIKLIPVLSFKLELLK